MEPFHGMTVQNWQPAYWCKWASTFTPTSHSHSLVFAPSHSYPNWPYSLIYIHMGSIHICVHFTCVISYSCRMWAHTFDLTCCTCTLTHVLEPYFIHSILYQLSHPRSLASAQDSFSHITNLHSHHTATAHMSTSSLCNLLLMVEGWRGFYRHGHFVLMLMTIFTFFFFLFLFSSDHCFALSYHQWSCFQVVEC